MNRVFIIGSVAFVLCVIGYFSGRSYQRSELAHTTAPHSPGPTTLAVAPPADFGHVVYQDLAAISFADLYETMRSAPLQQRAEWLQQIEQMQEGPRKVSALCGFLRALVQIDPVAAGDLVVRLKRHRSPAMDAVIAAAPPSAMPRMVEMLLKLPEAVRSYQLTDHLEVVLESWALVDPEAVAQFFEEHKDIQLQQYSDQFVREWAGIDHEAAWRWLEAHPDIFGSFAIESWLNGWFETDPESALNFGLSHIDDETFGDAIKSLVPDLFQQDPSRAKELVEKLPTPEFRRAALERIAYLGGSPAYTEEYEPAAVANFFLRFPPDEWPSAFSDVINRWRFRDSAELLEWISRLPAPAQDKVIEDYPDPISYDVEEELIPVLQLPDSELRTKLLRRVIQSMTSENESAANAIEKLKLSPEQKSELFALVPKESQH